MAQDMVLPEPTAEELDAMVNHIALLDTEGKGVNPSQLRVFYPRLGWNVIYQRLYLLRDTGRLHMQRVAKGRVNFEHFSIPVNSGE